jgi:hypothetical protein
MAASNFRQLGPLDIHFCYMDGRRTVEVNGREIILGNRVRDTSVQQAGRYR